jgi:excisionase family DNA binding protein
MGKLKILVVEDESVVREYVKGTLQDLGYMVTAAVITGEDAVKQAEKTLPDVVLMDIRLKGKLDGIDAAKQISSRFDIPVVYLTSYADDNTLERAKVTKPFGYVMKPFDDKELRATIEIAVHKSREEKKVKERLLHELQSTTRKIFGITHKFVDTGSAHPSSDIPGTTTRETTTFPTEEQEAGRTFTIKDAAKYLGISDRTIQRMMKEGIFPEPSVTIDIGGNRKLRRWKQEDLDTVKPHLRGRGRPKSHHT